MVVRMKLKEIFNVPRSQGSHVENGIVVSDGHNHSDLKVISLEAMNAYLGTESDEFFKTLEKVIQKITDECDLEASASMIKEREERAEIMEEQRKRVLNTMDKLATHADNLSAEIEATSPKKRGRPAKSI